MADETKPTTDTTTAATPNPPTAAELAKRYYEAATPQERKALCEEFPFLKQTFSEANHPTK